MKKTLLTLSCSMLLFFGISLSANAADYYVDATGGLDGNLGTSAGAAWQTISKVNGTVLAPGDNVYFKRGETWNEQLNITTSGTEGSLITFGAYDSGNVPVIDAQNTRSYAINFSSDLSYIKLENLRVQNGTTGNIWADGTGQNLELNNIESIGGVAGIWLSAKSDLTVETVSVSNATDSNFAGLRIAGSSADSISLDNITVNGNAGYGIEISGVSNLSATSLSASSNGKNGIYLFEVDTATISTSTSQMNTGVGSGFYVEDSSNIVISNSIANNNFWNGFVFNGGSNNKAFKCKAHNNGTIGSINSGNGFISSDTVSSLEIHQSVSYENRSSGVSLADSSSGELFNSTFYSNGEPGFTKGGFYSRVSGGSGWELRNNIFKDNYPYELNTDANGWGNTDIDYNVYHHTANAEVVTLNNAVSTMDWDTYHTTNSNETNGVYADPLFVAAGSGNFAIQTLSSAIDVGTMINGVTQSCSGDCTDFSGNSIYGTVDFGAYEFQPTKVMGTDDIDIAGGAIVYADGKYRNENSPSSSVADLMVRPEADFSSSQYGEWMSIDISTWETSGSYNKVWVEDSDAIGSVTTSHTVGDLASELNYDVYYTKQGGSRTKLGFYKSNASGEISFDYDLGYSTVTFEVEEGDNTIPVITNTTDSTITTNTASVSMSVSTSESATCKFSTSSGSDFASMTSFSTTGGTSHKKSLSATISEDRTYYVICQDASENLSSEVSVSFSIVVTEVSGLKPKMKVSNNQKLAFKKLSKKLYSKNNKPRFSGESEALVNGKVVIYVDGDEEEEAVADSNGKWKQKVKFKKNKTYELKFKYYDQNNNLIDSKKYKLKIDTEDPEFTSFPPEMIAKRVGQSIWWDAEDNHKVKKYKIYFGGKKIKTKENRFDVPGGIANGIHQLKVKAYDKAGNKEEKVVNIRVW